jgi:hypothetical protein
MKAASRSIVVTVASALTLGVAATATAADSFTSRFVSLSSGQPGVLYEPATPGPKAAIAVFAMHDNGDYLRPRPGNPCRELAMRGYRVLCSNSTASKSGYFSDDDIDKLLLNVKAGVAWLRADTDVKSVVIFGHSGGGAMMAAYQNVAENGVQICQDATKIVKCPDTLAGMPAADGVMLIDSVLGGPVSTLFSLDPAVLDDSTGQPVDPKLDMYSPANGFDPKGSHYSAAFERRFFAAQGARMNRLIAKAQARLKLIEAGKGRYVDDEPFIVAGAMGAQNRLNAQDLALQAHTKQAWPLLHADGTVTTEIVRSVRTPHFKKSPTPLLAGGSIQTSVRKFLSTWAVRTNSDYHFDATMLHGVDHASSYVDEVYSIQGITRPLLQMGMTGSYEFWNSEIAREHAVSADKTLAYVEGAVHDFVPCEDCALAQGWPANHYGDTVKTLFDYIDGWLGKPGRFIASSADVPSGIAGRCQGLVSGTIEGGTITAAQLVAAGKFSPPPSDPTSGTGADPALYEKLPAFCRVEAALKPSSNSDIRIEVWLPTSGWNGKLVESGNGAFSPALSYNVMAQMLSQGYAATSSNTGHTGNSAAFAVGHPEKIIDFGYRAVHVDAVAAKAIANAFYDKAVDKSYFQGCSTGGRQAYGAVQHFPDDFDGIVAGAPGINFTHQTAAELAIVLQIHKDPSLLISHDQLNMLHAAVLQACDAEDGIKDGVIENPLRCNFDPASLECRGTDTLSCLMAGQVKLARQIYDGVHDSSGKLVFGGLPKGTEATWGNTLIRTDPMAYGVDAYRDVVLQNPAWDYLTLNVDTDIPAADARVGSIVNNYDPDLRPYFARGGKILGYQGWSDGMNSPLNHIGYYEKVATVMGGANALASSYRLFLVPGMEHCGGGEGTSSFDLLGVLDDWVVKRKAPDSIPAARIRNGNVDRTRPLCPYPRQAVYRGSGSTDDASNFSCRVSK